MERFQVPKSVVLMEGDWLSEKVLVNTTPCMTGQIVEVFSPHPVEDLCAEEIGLGKKSVRFFSRKPFVALLASKQKRFPVKFRVLIPKTYFSEKGKLESSKLFNHRGLHFKQDNDKKKKWASLKQLHFVSGLSAEQIFDRFSFLNSDGERGDFEYVVWSDCLGFSDVHQCRYYEFDWSTPEKVWIPARFAVDVMYINHFATLSDKDPEQIAKKMKVRLEEIEAEAKAN